MLQSIRKPRRSSTPKLRSSPSSVPSFPQTPQTPQTPHTLITPRRSSRWQTPKKDLDLDWNAVRTPKSAKKVVGNLVQRFEDLISPKSPHLREPKKRKRAVSSVKVDKKSKSKSLPKKRVYYKKVSFDGSEFETGDDVYVKRREDAISDDEDPEVEQCRICFKCGQAIMIECDDCLAGFHLKCLKPPLKEVPEGDWICGFCEGRKLGQNVELPKPPNGVKLSRTAKEKLLSSDLWAAHIESLWREPDGSYWFKGRWYIIPDETAAGRQPHNLRRELYRTNDFADIEMESVIRHCFVMNPKEFSKANNGGDDVFLCEYEYDIHWHSFKRLAEVDNNEEDNGKGDNDEEWGSCMHSGSDIENDLEYEDQDLKASLIGLPHHEVAANSWKGRIFGIQKIGAKKIPEHVRCHKQTELERAKTTLLLATLPKSLPCRNKEMEEITAFVRDAIYDDQCLGRCLYIYGVPGTGKTMSVLSVMKNLRSEVDIGRAKPYCFIEINGLKLASPENIYKVLYNILDWPTKPNSKLVVIGIANTMDLPEKLLPRISSRMGIQRLCFGPYNYHQLQEIISSRLTGIDAFEKQAIEFASRKVAAISGDARRALEISRCAAELADYRLKQSSNGKPLVGMADVEAAIQEMFQAPHIQVMKSCSKLSKMFLVALVHELYKTGTAETTFEKVSILVLRFCSSNGEVFPGFDALLKVGCMLGECRIILCEPGARHRLQKLQLNFPRHAYPSCFQDIFYFRVRYPVPVPAPAPVPDIDMRIRVNVT
ncbi:hypothetical protein GIB67_010334 [Kingdonia uniflora]|uniref:Origin recognition complex subunit 1 n=1 Tax=Kingdonia uniflora TaxID=39325 RepID=A0A7J7MAG2_9MAGN|nr:hypothetical protein GIB67_010334 [Kingdonia uniflora]